MRTFSKYIALAVATAMTLAAPLAMASPVDDIVAQEELLALRATGHANNLSTAMCAGAPPCTGGHLKTLQDNAGDFADNTAAGFSPDFATLAAQRDDLLNSGSSSSLASQANAALLCTTGCASPSMVSAVVGAGSGIAGIAIGHVGVIAPGVNGFAADSLTLVGGVGYAQRNLVYTTGNATFVSATGFALGQAGSARSTVACSAFGTQTGPDATCTTAGRTGDGCVVESAATQLVTGATPSACNPMLNVDPTQAVATPAAPPAGPETIDGALKNSGTPLRV